MKHYKKERKKERTQTQRKKLYTLVAAIFNSLQSILFVLAMLAVRFFKPQ